MTASTRERDRRVQACLQKLVAPTLTVDGALGPRSHQALREFQRRVREFVPDAPALAVGGLKPSRASVAFQRSTPLHAWLVARAWEFGFHPYKTAPWHWEHPLSLAAHRSGVLAADDPGPPVDAASFGLDDGEEDVLEDMDLEEQPG